MYGRAIAAVLLIGAVGIFAVQGVLWLRDGYWTAFLLSDVLTLVGLQVPEFEWGGLAEIVYWYWLVHQWVGWHLVVLAVLVSFVGFRFKT